MPEKSVKASVERLKSQRASNKKQTPSSSLAVQRQELRTTAAVTKFEPWITRTPFFNTGLPVVDQLTGEKIYTACNNQIFCVSSTSGNFTEIITLSEDENISQLAVDESGTVIIVATQRLLRHYITDSSSSEVRLERTWKSMHNAQISRLELFSHDSSKPARLLLSASSDSTIKVWDLQNQYCTHNLKGSSGVIRSAKFFPYAENRSLPARIVSGADDCMLRIWNLTPSSCVATLKGHMSPITDVVTYSTTKATQHDRAITSSREKLLILWDLDEPKSLIMVPVYNQIESLAYYSYKPIEGGDELHAVMLATQDNAASTLGGEMLTIQIWDVQHARCLKQLPPVKTRRNATLPASSKLIESRKFAERIVSSITLLPNNRVLVATSDNCMQICSLDMPNLQHYTQERQLAGTNDDEIVNLALLGPKRDAAIILTNSTRMYLYDLRRWTCTFIDNGHTEAPVAVATFRNNFFVTGSKDNNIKLWRFDENELDAELLSTGIGHAHTVTDVACFCLVQEQQIQPYILSASEDLTLKLWTTTRNSFMNGNPTANSDAIQLICMQTVAAHRKPLNCVAVDNDAEYVITGSQDKIGLVYSVSRSTQSCRLNAIGELSGHSRGIWCCNIKSRRESRNGIALAVTGSADSLVKVWTLNDFSCVHTLNGHECSVLKVRFLPTPPNAGAQQQQQVVSAASDGLIKLWTIPASSGGKAVPTCTDTYDQHSDRVWGLDLSPYSDDSDSNELFYAAMLTGGADSRLCLWRNVTERVVTEARDVYNSAIARQQTLSNVMYAKDYKKAFHLALELEQPFTLLQISKELLTSGADIEELVADSPNIERLLSYVAEWNTNTRHALAAQNVLRAILSSYTQAELLAMPAFRSNIDGLLAYNERHLQRADALKVQSHFLSFLLSAVRQGFEADDDEVLAMKRKQLPLVAKYDAHDENDVEMTADE